jgi:phosphoglycerol transferase MdoB-like AlkP superfamily enzyme
MRSQDTPWSYWFTNALRLVMVWIALVAILQAFRIHLLWKYAGGLKANTHTADILAALWMGFRFDSAISAVMLLLPFLVISGYSVLAGLCLKNTAFIQRSQSMVTQFAKWFVIFMGILTATLCAANIPFFQEYHESYNQFVFEAFYDDPKAIVQTAIKQSQPILYFVTALCISVVFVLWLNVVYQYRPKRLARLLSKHKLAMTATTLTILVMTVAACRGGLDQRPVMRKWASISPDQMLNKLIINPIRSLHYAYEDYKEIQAPTEGNPFSKHIKVPPLKQLAQTSIGNDEQPDHIVLVVMESYDAWPLMDKYRPLKLSTQVSAIADKGIHFKHFLPASNSTMNSLVSIVSGVAYTGANHSRQMTYQTPNPLSIFQNFNQLGYETFFFYGGFLSWQNVGAFAASQGAQHIYSAPDVGGKTESGVWGVDDEQLFQMVLQKLPQNRKTFSIVLTTSYHGPYTVDIYKKGFPYKKWSDLPEEFDSLVDQKSMQLIEMGHLWYSDQAIGDFVKQFEKSYSNPLISLTGDHFGRRFLNQKPTLAEKSLVPFILYPSHWVEDKSIATRPGTHIDIAPTLIDIASKNSANYYSLGRSLLNKAKSSTVFGHKLALAGHKLLPIELASAAQIHEEKNARIENRYKEIKALHWELSHGQQLKAHYSEAFPMLRHQQAGTILQQSGRYGR